MKSKKLKLLTTFLLLLPLCVALLGAGCDDDDEGEWIPIDSLMADSSTSTYLNTIFSGNNNCLTDFQQDTVCEIFYSQEEFGGIDSCNIIPEIDFQEYSLISGKITVPRMVSNISNVTLTYNSAQNLYRIEVLVDECEECYTVIGYLYFWRLYPSVKLILI